MFACKERACQTLEQRLQCELMITLGIDSEAAIMIALETSDSARSRCCLILAQFC